MEGIPSFPVTSGARVERRAVMSERAPIDAAALLEQSRWVRRLARGLALDDSAADDLAQDVHLAALRRSRPIRGEPRAWLAGVARNLALRWRRGERVRRLHEERAAEVRAASDGEEEALARLRLQRALADALLALHEPYRRAVVERYLDGRSYGELAARLELGEVAARKRVSRGLELLRERLGRERASGTWALVLAFARPAEPGGSAVLVGSVAMGAKLALVGSLVLLGTAGFWLWRPEAQPPGPSRAPVIAAAAPERAADEARVRAEPSMDGEDVARVPVPPAAVVAAPPGSSAGAEHPGELRRPRPDAEGRPASGPPVELWRDRFREYSTLPSAAAPSARRGRLVARAQTDEAGLFAAALDVGRPFDLRVEARGHAPATLPERVA